MYENYKNNEICPDCRIVKVPRSRHCHQCHRCVRKFDHHCQWLNNCIGARNIGPFYIFVLSLWVNIVIGIWICGTVFGSKKTDNDGDDISLVGSQVIGAFCIVIELIMFLPVSYLLWTHTNNLVLGLTTNERQSTNKSSKSSNGCAKNCFTMCCNVETIDDRSSSRLDSMASTANPLEVSMQAK